MRVHRDKLKRAKRARQTIGNAYGDLVVKRTERSVRIIAISKRGPSWTGRPSEATFGVVDLDDAMLERLIERLQAIRGGKKRLPPRTMTAHRDGKGEG